MSIVCGESFCMFCLETALSVKICSGKNFPQKTFSAKISQCKFKCGRTDRYELCNNPLCYDITPTDPHPLMHTFLGTFWGCKLSSPKVIAVFSRKPLSTLTKMQTIMLIFIYTQSDPCHLIGRKLVSCHPLSNGQTLGSILSFTPN